MLGYFFLRTVMSRVLGDVSLDAASISAAREADEAAIVDANTQVD